VSAPGKGTRATLIVPLEEGKEMASGQ
jgi:hypothetical protein